MLICPHEPLKRRFPLRVSVLCMTLACVIPTNSRAAAELPEPAATARIAVREYQDKVHASWLGQIVGNIYGLAYEFRFIESPGPDEFPYGFGASLERVRGADGAFSDDDTDVEYMYLLQMERHGIEPTYRQLSEAWKYHVRDRIWAANRMALALMRAGYSPPLTGNRDYNPQWFQIDPQLVNEIWAVTAPGMVDYATAKSAWAARITNDGFGIEPTIHYAAMYAAAFFEDDIGRLIDIGTSALPAGARFAGVVEHMKGLHRRYPEDWRAARREMAGHYYYGNSGMQGGALEYGAFHYNAHAWPPLDAILNGACAILALLYGEGDFQRTLDLASAMGFDADNQAATLSGLLGIVHGTAGIPSDLLYPLGRDEWDHPYNDFYKNVTRHDLPDASLRDMAARMAAQGEKVILAHGGRVVTEGAQHYYEVNAAARFEAPLELASAPVLLAEVGRPFSFRHFYGGESGDPAFALAAGTLPPGIELSFDRIRGTATGPGYHEFTLQVDAGGESRRQAYAMRVNGANLARGAQRVLVNDTVAAVDIELIRDGEHRGRTFYNRSPDDQPRTNYYGYAWEEPQFISSLVFNPGLPEEFGGWFTSLDVQYLDDLGAWRPVRNLAIEPGMDFANNQWLKGAFIDHTLAFEPVRTIAIRMIGQAGGVEPDPGYPRARRYYTAISELAVYVDAVSSHSGHQE